MSRGILASAVVVVLAGLPRAAEACAVCTAGRDEESRAAFIWTTVFMSVMPLLVVGGIVWWLRRAVRAQQAEQARVAAGLAPRELGG